MQRLKPTQLIVFSFLVTIIIGGLMLSLPQSSHPMHPVRLIDAFFAATSATCVTGLTTLDIGKDFSKFGQLVILVLIQIGGLGIMTFSTFFSILLGRKLTLRENIVVKGALGQHNVEGLKALIMYILLITFTIEIVGVLFLYRRFNNVYSSIFHAVSAFCNAGFSIYTNNLENYRGDILVNVTIILLIILGGIGFTVLIDSGRILKAIFIKVFLKKRRPEAINIFSNINLQTKIVATVTAILILIGTIVFFLLENSRTLYGLSIKDKILSSFFQSVTPRTAGFNTVPTVNLASPTLFFMIILMFIGASPGSTGGGIKTCTFGILIAGAWSMIKNRKDISIFKRTIPQPIFRKAVMIAGLSMAWVVLFTMFLCSQEARNEAMPNYFLRVFFEVTSAFGTVGLSTGITPILSSFGKLLIMFTMFLGRIGPLTLAMAVAMKEDKIFYKYPEEKVMVG